MLAIMLALKFSPVPVETQSVAVEIPDNVDSDETKSGVQVSVIPGTPVTIPYTVTNNGNLREEVLVNVSVEGNWEVTPGSSSYTLEIDEVDGNSITVEVPSLGGLENLANGEIRNVTFLVTDAVTGAALSSTNVQIVIAPLFDIEILEWEDEYFFNRGLTRTLNGVIKNVGNSDVQVYANSSVQRAGLNLPSNDWFVSNGESQILDLKIGQSKSFSIDVEFVEFEPDLTLIGDLIVTIEPVDDEVTGTAMLESTLRLSRLFQDVPVGIVPPESGGAVREEIVWSHIPLGAGTIANYEIELCAAQRGINPQDFNLEPEEVEWSFTCVLPSIFTNRNAKVQSSNVSCKS